jgi:two-component system sensor histidine kinase/response regulator
MNEPIVKILLVDDLRENLIALEALLLSSSAGSPTREGRDGLELLSARSGREALELLLVHDVALALIDLQMPEMDGLELAELMRGSQRTRHVPIIFVTAATRDRQRMFRGYEVGAVDFLYKPIEPVLLGHKVATFVDLHRQRLERERLADELREMLRLNEMFVAAVSHDLRSPLSTLLMGASVLNGKLVDPTLERTLARMRSSAERMRGMLDELYDLARVRLAGGIAIEPSPTDFGRLAQRVADELRVAHPERSLLVEAEGGSSEGHWDEARLAQVLANLIGNALRHGDSKQPVRVRWQGAVEALVLEVHNGGAIPSSVREHLFDPFRRGTRARDSLGLGLYIVRQIVLAHAGSIDVASTESDGTTFRVRLPWRAPFDAASSVASEVVSGVVSVDIEGDGSGSIEGAAAGGMPPAE